MGSFLSKACNVSARKFHRNYVITLKGNAMFEDKLILGSKNVMKNLAIFNASRGKSEDLAFDVLFLSKVYYV